MGSTLIWLVSLWEEMSTHRATPGLHIQWDDHVKRQHEGSHPQAKQRVLRGNQTCWHLDLGVPASSYSWENKFLLFKPPSLVFCYGSPRKLIRWPITKAFLHVSHKKEPFLAARGAEKRVSEWSQTEWYHFLEHYYHPPSFQYCNSFHTMFPSINI